MEDEYLFEESDSDNETTKIDDYFMYKVCPKNKGLNFCYIGHTNNFVNRIRQHKNASENEKHSKAYQRLYETIRNNGGWSEWEMIEIDKIYGKPKLEARMREQELIDEYNANINSVSTDITEEQRKATKKACTEKYRVENKELLKEQTKKYKEHHKEVISEQMKTYRAENKEKINEKTKEYKEKNKEKHQEWQKVWQEKNKEILKEKRKIYNAKKKQEKLEELQQEQKE